MVLIALLLHAKTQKLIRFLDKFIGTLEPYCNMEGQLLLQRSKNSVSECCKMFEWKKSNTYSM